MTPPSSPNPSGSLRRNLYSATPFARENLFALQEVGLQEMPPRFESRREKLESFLFLFVEEGTGFIETNGLRREIRAGDVFFWDCRRPYAHLAGARPWKIRWVHFDGRAVPALHRDFQSQGGRSVFRAADSGIYRSICEDLSFLAENPSVQNELRINELLSRLLFVLFRDGKRPESGFRDSGIQRQRTEQVRLWIQKHHSEPVSLSDLSRRFGINRFSLSREFRRNFGTTVFRYLEEVRILHAKRLLRFTDRPIEALAEICGFPDANYFSRVFRRSEGVSPRTFRNQWKG